MSLPTPKSAAFIARWNPRINKPTLLVQLDVTAPSALSLYWTLDPAVYPDPVAGRAGNPNGKTWQPVITSTDPISAPGGLLEAGPSLCSFGFKVANTRMIPQASGTLTDLLNAYRFKGATVTAWLWECGLPLSEFNPNVFDFRGVVQGVTPGQDSHYFRCQQRKDWSRKVPPTSTTRGDFPNVSEANLGKPLPLIYGLFGNDGMSDPWTAAYPGNTPSAKPKQVQEDLGASGLVVPGIVVDSGIGSAPTRVLFAAHPLAFLGNATDQQYVKTPAGDALADVVSVTGDILSDKSGFDLHDENFLAYVGIPCIDVRASGTYPNSALNPRAALDIFDDTSYATVAVAGSKNLLSLIVGSVGQLGQIVSAEFVIGYRCSSNVTPLQIRWNRPNNVGTLPGYATLIAHNGLPALTAVVQRLGPITISPDATNPATTGTVTSDWNFGAGDIHAFIDPANTGHYAHVFFVGLVVQYRPAQSLVVPAQFTGPAGGYDVAGRRVDPRRNPNVKRGDIYGGWGGNYTSPLYDVQSQFYTNAAGRADDGSGTYSGVAAELLERPQDILRHLLAVYGADASIETAINRFGSFVRSRPATVSLEGNPLAIAVHVGDTGPITYLIERICRQTATWCYLSRFDDKWHFVPWERRPAAQNFPRTLEPEDVIEIAMDDLSETEIANDVRVDYAMDFYRNRYAHTCAVGQTASDGGFASRGRRDQAFVVVTAANDKLDFTRSATTYAATLAAGTYTPAQAMVATKAALVALAISGARWNVAWGGTIVVSHNDRLDYTVAGTAYNVQLAAGAYQITELPYLVQRAMAPGNAGVKCALGFHILEGFNDAIDFSDGTQKRATIPPGWYRDGAQLAAYIKLALNSVSTGWDCTYNGGTSKFGITRASGTAQLLWFTGATVASNAAAALGYAHGSDRTGALSYTADYARVRGICYVQSITLLTLNWATGTNKANSIAVTIGHDTAADASGSLNLPGAYVPQDETYAVGEGTAFTWLWASGTNVAKTAAFLLGFLTASDDAAAKWSRADRRRGGREADCAASVAAYEEKHPYNEPALDIRTTEGALHLRDVVVDRRADVPLVLNVKTHRFPDLERGRVIATGDLSRKFPWLAVPPKYGAGAWAGKLWRVAQVQQYSGRTWHQEITLIEEKPKLLGGAMPADDGATGGAPAVPAGTVPIVWLTTAAGVTTAYVGRLDATAGLMNVAAPWAANGEQASARPIAADSYWTQARPVVDATGKVIVAIPSSNDNVYEAAQFSAAGALLWRTQVANSALFRVGCRVAPDSNRGAYLLWNQLTPGLTQYQPTLVRVANDGTLPWGAGGIACSTGDLVKGSYPTLAPDGLGGVFVVWPEKVGSFQTLKAIHVDANGTSLWGATPVTVSTLAAADSLYPQVLADGAGGCFVVWQYGAQIYAQRILSDASRFWLGTGVQLVGATADSPQLCTDGTGGIFVTWHDTRSSTNKTYGQRVNASGAVQWTTGGLELIAVGSSAASGNAGSGVQLIKDAAGSGAFVVAASAAADYIQAQRFDGSGNRLWGTGLVVAHVAACARPGLSYDGDTGVVVTYTDSFVVKAQRAAQDGSLIWPGGLTVSNRATTDDCAHAQLAGG